MNELVERLKTEWSDKETRQVYCDEFLNASIGTQIKVLREERGLTQAQLAALADMKQPRIAALEDVNYSSWTINVLRRLAEAFDLALTVKFDSFGEKLRDIESFSGETFQRPSFEQDPVFQVAAVSHSATSSHLSGDPRTVSLTLPTRTLNLSLPSLTDALAQSDSVARVEEIGTGKLLAFQASKERLEAEGGRRTSPSRSESQTRLGKMPSTQSKANTMRAGRQ